MRQQKPTALVLAISLALFANAALAQRASTGAAGAGAARAGAPAAATAAPATSGQSATAPTSNGNTNATNNGNTNATGNSSNGNQVTMGTPVNGTNPNPNTTQGQTSGVTNGSTTGTSNGSTSPGVVPSGVANTQARLFDANGRMLTDANGNALVTDGVSVIGVSPVGAGFEGVTIGVDPNQVVVANASLMPSASPLTSRPSPELDRATRKELAKARQAATTNRQLLTTIAPRTNADRTDQMADDPVPTRY